METLHIRPAARLMPGSVSTSSWRTVLSDSVYPVPHRADSIKCFMKVLRRNTQFNLCLYLNRLFILGWCGSAQKLFFSSALFYIHEVTLSQAWGSFYLHWSSWLFNALLKSHFYLLSTQIYPSWTWDLNQWPSGHKPHYSCSLVSEFEPESWPRKPKGWNCVSKETAEKKKKKDIYLLFWQMNCWCNRKQLWVDLLSGLDPPQESQDKCEGLWDP